MKTLWRAWCRGIRVFWFFLRAALSLRRVAASAPGSAEDVRRRAAWLRDRARELLEVLAIRVSASGGLAQGGVVACNHLGYLDALVIASLSPTVFVAKAEVARWPVLGWFCRQVGTLFIQRDHRDSVARLQPELRRVLSAGVTVCLFLEGTSTDGSRVQPFHSSLLQPAVEGVWPVRPGWLGFFKPDGTVEPAAAYWRDMWFAPHFLRLLATAPFTAQAWLGESVDPWLSRKRMARVLHALVAHQNCVSRARLSCGLDPWPLHAPAYEAHSALARYAVWPRNPVETGLECGLAGEP